MITVAKAAGTELRLHASLVLMMLLIVVVYSPQFSDVTDRPLIAGAAMAVALVVSVLLHEVAHFAAARTFGMRVPAIELHLMGGHTEIDGGARTPAQDLIIAVVGPMTSALVGFVALTVTRGAEPTATTAVLWALGVVNLLLAVVNLLPAPPLDGGAVLSAIVWWITGRETSGVIVAAWVGRLSAIVIALLGAISANASSFAGISRLVIALLVAWFLWSSAKRSLVFDLRRARVNALQARTLARPGRAPAGSPRIAADLGGRDLLIAMMENPADVYSLVEKDGSAPLMLLAADVDAAYSESAR